MARPISIKVDDGVVILKNLSKEKSDEIRALLGGEKTVGEQLITALEETVEAQQNADNTYYNAPLTDTALSIRKNSSGCYELVSVKYNADTKQAIVESIANYKFDKQIAVGDFKVLVSKLFL